jgi:hypothetical protein
MSDIGEIHRIKNLQIFFDRLHSVYHQSILLVELFCSKYLATTGFVEDIGKLLDSLKSVSYAVTDRKEL